MIKSSEYKGKNLDDVLAEIGKDLELNVEDINYQAKQESRLLSKTFVVTVYQKEDILNYIQELIVSILENMQIKDINVEIMNKEHGVMFNIMTNNNAVIIGKDGRNIEALQYYVRNVIHNIVDLKFNIILDVENYKLKKQKKVVRLAHSLADDALQTGESISMKGLNSYERRLIHQELGKSDLINTYSEGTGAERHLVIEPKEKV